MADLGSQFFSWSNAIKAVGAFAGSGGSALSALAAIGSSGLLNPENPKAPDTGSTLGALNNFTSGMQQGANMSRGINAGISANSLKQINDSLQTVTSKIETTNALLQKILDYHTGVGDINYQKTIRRNNRLSLLMSRTAMGRLALASMSAAAGVSYINYTNMTKGAIEKGVTTHEEIMSKKLLSMVPMIGDILSGFSYLSNKILQTKSDFTNESNITLTNIIPNRLKGIITINNQILEESRRIRELICNGLPVYTEFLTNSTYTLEIMQNQNTAHYKLQSDYYTKTLEYQTNVLMYLKLINGSVYDETKYENNKEALEKKITELISNVNENAKDETKGERIRYKFEDNVEGYRLDQTSKEIEEKITIMQNLYQESLRRFTKKDDQGNNIGNSEEEKRNAIRNIAAILPAVMTSRGVVDALPNNEREARRRHKEELNATCAVRQAVEDSNKTSKDILEATISMRQTLINFTMKLPQLGSKFASTAIKLMMGFGVARMIYRFLSPLLSQQNNQKPGFIGNTLGASSFGEGLTSLGGYIKAGLNKVKTTITDLGIVQKVKEWFAELWKDTLWPKIKEYGTVALQYALTAYSAITFLPAMMKGIKGDLTQSIAGVGQLGGSVIKGTIFRFIFGGSPNILQNQIMGTRAEVGKIDSRALYSNAKNIFSFTAGKWNEQGGLLGILLGLPNFLLSKFLNKISLTGPVQAIVRFFTTPTWFTPILTSLGSSVGWLFSSAFKIGTHILKNFNIYLMVLGIVKMAFNKWKDDLLKNFTEEEKKDVDIWTLVRKFLIDSVTWVYEKVKNTIIWLWENALPLIGKGIATIGKMLSRLIFGPYAEKVNEVVGGIVDWIVWIFDKITYPFRKLAEGIAAIYDWYVRTFGWLLGYALDYDDNVSKLNKTIDKKNNEATEAAEKKARLKAAENERKATQTWREKVTNIWTSMLETMTSFKDTVIGWFESLRSPKTLGFAQGGILGFIDSILGFIDPERQKAVIEKRTNNLSSAISSAKEEESYKNKISPEILKLMKFDEKGILSNGGDIITIGDREHSLWSLWEEALLESKSFKENNINEQNFTAILTSIGKYNANVKSKEETTTEAVNKVNSNVVSIVNDIKDVKSTEATIFHKINDGIWKIKENTDEKEVEKINENIRETQRNTPFLSQRNVNEESSLYKQTEEFERILKEERGILIDYQYDKELHNKVLDAVKVIQNYELLKSKNANNLDKINKEHQSIHSSDVESVYRSINTRIENPDLYEDEKTNFFSKESNGFFANTALKAIEDKFREENEELIDTLKESKEPISMKNLKYAIKLRKYINEYRKKKDNEYEELSKRYRAIYDIANDAIDTQNSRLSTLRESNGLRNNNAIWNNYMNSSSEDEFNQHQESYLQSQMEHLKDDAALFINGEFGNRSRYIVNNILTKNTPLNNIISKHNKGEEIDSASLSNILDKLNERNKRGFMSFEDGKITYDNLKKEINKQLLNLNFVDYNGRKFDALNFSGLFDKVLQDDEISKKGKPLSLDEYNKLMNRVLNTYTLINTSMHSFIDGLDKSFNEDVNETIGSIITDKDFNKDSTVLPQLNKLFSDELTNPNHIVRDSLSHLLSKALKSKEKEILNSLSKSPNEFVNDLLTMNKTYHYMGNDYGLAVKYLKDYIFKGQKLDKDGSIINIKDSLKGTNRDNIYTYLVNLIKSMTGSSLNKDNGRTAFNTNSKSYYELIDLNKMNGLKDIVDEIEKTSNEPNVVGSVINESNIGNATNKSMPDNEQGDNILDVLAGASDSNESIIRNIDLTSNEKLLSTSPITIIESLTTKNNAFGKRYIKPKGLMLHSVGVANPNAKNFVKLFNNRKPYGKSVAVHGFIDANTGDVYKTLPWNMRGWHGGRKRANDNYIGVEMTEPSYIKYKGGASFNILDREKAIEQALRTYNSATYLFAALAKKYNLNPLTDIISHNEGRIRKIASPHFDPDHLWQGLGLDKNMDTFREDVKSKMSGIDISILGNDNEEVLYPIRKGKRSKKGGAWKGYYKDGWKDFKGQKSWSKYIYEAAMETGIDPELISAIIMQESRGNPNAVSRTGAIGLMQLFPAAIKDVHKFYPSSSKYKDRRNPKDNIFLGSYYLKLLTEKYLKGYPLKDIINGYNWGAGNVRSLRNKGHIIKGYENKIDKNYANNVLRFYGKHIFTDPNTPITDTSNILSDTITKTSISSNANTNANTYTPSTDFKDYKYNDVKSYIRLNKSNIHFDELNKELRWRVVEYAKAFKELHNRPILITSAFRTFKEQQDLYKRSRKGYAAKPGYSRHEKGFAIDINKTDLDDNLLKRFGLVRPLPHEKWHVEGVEWANKKGINFKTYTPPHLNLYSSTTSNSSNPTNPLEAISKELSNNPTNPIDTNSPNTSNTNTPDTNGTNDNNLGILDRVLQDMMIKANPGVKNLFNETSALKNTLYMLKTASYYSNYPDNEQGDNILDVFSGLIPNIKATGLSLIDKTKHHIDSVPIISKAKAITDGVFKTNWIEKLDLPEDIILLNKQEELKTALDRSSSGLKSFTESNNEKLLEAINKQTNSLNNFANTNNRELQLMFNTFTKLFTDSILRNMTSINTTNIVSDNSNSNISTLQSNNGNSSNSGSNNNMPNNMALQALFM